MEKDVYIISHNEPLLFVHGPPIFISVAVTDEESTSVFVRNVEESDELSNIIHDEIQPVELANPSIVNKINNLGGSFQRQVYRPLKFVIGDEILSGIIQKNEGEMVYIELDGEENVIVPVKVSMIKEILWRGEPFEES